MFGALSKKHYGNSFCVFFASRVSILCIFEKARSVGIKCTFAVNCKDLHRKSEFTFSSIKYIGVLLSEFDFS